MKNTILSGVLLATAAAFGSASDGILYTDAFTGVEDETVATEWTQVTEESITVTNELAVSYDALSIVGDTLCTPAEVDKLTCRVAELDFVAEGADADPTEIPEDAQIEISTGITNESHTVHLWICDLSGWSDTGVTVDEGSTNSVSCVFTYDSPSTCDVIITNTAGVVLFTGTFTNRLSATSIAQVEVDGTTEIDNVYLADWFKHFDSSDAVAGEDLKGIVVAYTNLVKWGVDAVKVTSTQAPMLVTGMDTEEEAALFALTDYKTLENGKKQVTVPCEYENGQLYRVVFFRPHDVENIITTAEAEVGDISEEGTRTVTFEFPEESNFSGDKTILFTVQAYAPGE